MGPAFRRCCVGLVAGALLGAALLATPLSTAHPARAGDSGPRTTLAASDVLPVLPLPSAAAEPDAPTAPVSVDVSTPPPAPAPAPAAPSTPAPAPAAGPAGDVRLPLPVGQRQRIPILMYHELGDGENSLFVRVSEFEAQLDHLVRSGYQTVSLEQAYRHLFLGQPVPDRPVVITFDDAYATFYTVAFPALRSRKQTATLFVPTGLVGQSRYVTWDQIREMDRAGLDIEAHSVTHSDLSRLSGEALNREVAGSGRVLAEQLSHPVRHFAYPAGRYNPAVIDALKAAGFVTSVTTLPGGAGAEQDPFELRRVRISRGQSVAGFTQQLTLAVQPPVQR